MWLLWVCLSGKLKHHIVFDVYMSTSSGTIVVYLKCMVRYRCILMVWFCTHDIRHCQLSSDFISIMAGLVLRTEHFIQKFIAVSFHSSSQLRCESYGYILEETRFFFLAACLWNGWLNHVTVLFISCNSQSVTVNAWDNLPVVSQPINHSLNCNTYMVKNMLSRFRAVGIHDDWYRR